VNPTSEVVVRVSALAKRWDAASGLEAVTFDLVRGEMVVVAGRSGSGKSTLLALLAGWTEPDSGVIERVGVWAADGAWARWDRTAIIPQVIAPITELSMIENVALPLRIGGIGWGEARIQAAAVLTSVDLDVLAERPVADASLGQQQRLGVARAVVVHPTLLLADEPSSHQGPEHAALVLAALRGVADAGGAVLIATHDEAVAAAADRVIALNA
jgi:ABC-type lipoprotein export system ATPase subunit